RRTMPDYGGPTRAGARCTSPGSCAAIRNRAATWSRGRHARGRPRPPRPRPRRAASWARAADPLVSTPRPHTCGPREASPSAERLHCRDGLLARDDAVEPAIRLGCVVVERRVLVDHVDHRQAVTEADLVVVEVVRRRDLDAARAELGIDVLVRDDRDRALGDG